MAVKKRMLLPVLLILSLLLSSCRVRTAAPLSPDPLPASQAGEGAPGGEFLTDTGSLSDPEEGEAAPEEESGDRTRENPEAARKEYDENAPVEIVAGTDRLLHEEGEGAGRPRRAEEAKEKVSRVREGAEETALQTLPAEAAEEKGVSEDGKDADSAMTYYGVLLQDRMGSLFECQRTNVYWETAEDHVTVYKTSPEHALILQAGSYDVSARLLAENLRVDDGWVVRKNPQVIVKVVPSSVLGTGAGSAAAARQLAGELTRREGWASTEAVRSRRVLLLSEELLRAPHLQLAAMLMIAKTSAPELLADVDLPEALNRLSEEAAGTLPAGLFYYSLKED